MIGKGLGTLAEIGQSESTTFVLLQELTSMVGRYGKFLSDSDVKADDHQLEGLEFDETTRELLGLNNIGDMIGDLEATGMDVETIADDADPTPLTESTAGDETMSSESGMN